MEPNGVLTASVFGPDLLLVALLAVILFGGSKIGELGKGLGEGIRSFKDALKSDEKKEEEKVEEKK
jgi:sec-independent protein translocase protein TatA